MPRPSSVTRMRRRPPASMAISTWVGAGVERVLDEFLDRRSRPLDDLARGDAVDEQRIEAANRHGRGGPSRAYGVGKDQGEGRPRDLAVVRASRQGRRQTWRVRPGRSSSRGERLFEAGQGENSLRAAYSQRTRPFGGKSCRQGIGFQVLGGNFPKRVSGDAANFLPRAGTAEGIFRVAQRVSRQAEKPLRPGRSAPGAIAERCVGAGQRGWNSLPRRYESLDRASRFPRLHQWKLARLPTRKALSARPSTPDGLRARRNAATQAMALWEERERRRAEILARVDEAEAALARGEGTVIAPRRDDARACRRREGQGPRPPGGGERRAPLMAHRLAPQGFRRAGRHLAGHRQREAAAPNALTAWWRPSRAVFTCSPPIRALAGSAATCAQVCGGFRADAYVISYRIEGEDVLILHVLDGRRDIAALV